MSNHTSPFAALTGAEKQIRWLEYQSIRLPYVQADMDPAPVPKQNEAPKPEPPKKAETAAERPQPPPEVPRVMPDFQRSRHSQYDAVIARLKQADLQSRHLQAAQQSH